jgi:hypothetical protein
LSRCLSQGLNELRASVFHKLLAKYRIGKSQYQTQKKELEKLLGKPPGLLPRNASTVLPVLKSSFSGTTSLISSLESRLANSMSANEFELLKQKHADELQVLQTQAARTWELEAELTKAREAESKLQLEFDRRLAVEREIFATKYESEVNELRVSLGAKVESRDAKINEMEALRRLDVEQHDNELGLWRARDRKLSASLRGLEDALHGMLPSPSLLPSFHSFTPFPLLLVALAGAFPDSDGAATVALEECRAKQKIVRNKDSKAKLSSGELMALVKGRLQPVAEQESDLRQAIVCVFEALWPRWVVPDDIKTLLKWIPLVPNRVDVWKESAARAGAVQDLSFVLSWYSGVNLDQLEHLREGGLVGLDEAKLHQRARAIAECTNTSKLYDIGESDESLDDVDFEELGSAEMPQKASEDPADSSIPPSPSGDDFVLVARTAMLPCWNRLARQSPPNQTRISPFVRVCIELMPCPATFRSCTTMLFHLKPLMHQSLITCELDLA